MVVPDELPEGPFDLVVLAEVGYFVTPVDLLATLRRCEAALTVGGELLLCHWQHSTTGGDFHARRFALLVLG